MKRSGFTMIELIFVIVILGILAAVALPKFIGVSEQAQVGKLKGYVGTMNRTVAPALWSKSISTGLGGKVGTLFTDFNNTLPPLESLDDNGNPLAITSTQLANCGTTNATTIRDTNIGSSISGVTPEINASIIVGGVTYGLGCVEGNMSNSPQFYLIGDGKLIVK